MLCGGLRLPDAIQLFQTDQRVLVGGVLMIKFVLHQAGQPAELGHILPEKIHLVHRAQDGGDVAALVEDGEKGFRDVGVVQKIPVHQRDLAADELRQVGMQPQAALLRVQENPHQPARLVAEDAVARRVNLALDELEPVHRA